MDNEKLVTQKVKRIKERYVYEAIELVNQWRKLYECQSDENGQSIKYTLEQSAEIIGIPRKTLEDYYYQLKKAETLVNLQNFLNCKIGVIRRIVKENKTQRNPQLIDTNEFFIQENENSYQRKNSFEFDE